MLSSANSAPLPVVGQLFSALAIVGLLMASSFASVANGQAETDTYISTLDNDTSQSPSAGPSSWLPVNLGLKFNNGRLTLGTKDQFNNGLLGGGGGEEPKRPANKGLAQPTTTTQAPKIDQNKANGQSQTGTGRNSMGAFHADFAALKGIKEQLDLMDKEIEKRKRRKEEAKKNQPTTTSRSDDDDDLPATEGRHQKQSHLQTSDILSSSSLDSSESLTDPQTPLNPLGFDI